MAAKVVLKPLVVKLTEKQRRDLQVRANSNTDGNVSEWLRLAGLKYQPERRKKRSA